MKLPYRFSTDRLLMRKQSMCQQGFLAVFDKFFLVIFKIRRFSWC